MSLHALQQDMRAWLMTGEDRAASRFPAGALPGLLVYQNNYRAALMACLEESYPRTVAYLGTDAFRAAAARHIDDRPPDSWSLDHYAAHFPPALAAAFPSDPDVAELAMLELALSDAFVGPDCQALDAGELPWIDWDSATVRWVPTARLLAVQTNAADIWSALSAEDASPPDAELRPGRVLVWRHGETSCFRALDAVEAEFAPILCQGVGFADLCARLVAQLGEAEGVQRAGSWLGRWVADGLVARSGAIRCSAPAASG